MLEQKLLFCAENKFNVLLIGDAGVGKTAMVISTFNSLNLKWKYFSAATMDPWVDFIGVPKEMIDSDGTKYLDLIRMKGLDKVEALFFDELNRSHKKIRNAVMELIQFKSINGHKFPNLKIVWAAINPEDEEETYDVERLDPAQKDRFQVILEIPYKASMPYFKNKYGNNGIIAVEWWDKLPKETKKNVSPRRLDYVLEYYEKMGDIRDVLPIGVNVTELLSRLSNNILSKELEEIFYTKDSSRAIELMQNFSVQKTIIETLKSEEQLAFFLQFVDLEYLNSVIDNNKYFQIVLKNAPENKIFTETIKTFYKNTKDENIKNQILLFAKTNLEWGMKEFLLSKDEVLLNQNIPNKINIENFNKITKDLKDDKANIRNFALENIFKGIGLDMNKDEIQKMLYSLDIYIQQSNSNTLIKYKEYFKVIDFLMNNATILWKRKTTLDFFMSLNSIRTLKENNIYINKNFLI